MKIKKICVYCGSSPGKNPAFSQAAKILAKELCDRGIGLVFGGGAVGVMGVVADSMLEAGGEVIGVSMSFQYPVDTQVFLLCVSQHPVDKFTVNHAADRVEDPDRVDNRCDIICRVAQEVGPGT